MWELFGSDGYIRTAYDYTPYGSVTSEGSATQPVQWSSEVYDEELALVYYNYRHYNPMDGRWINRDPIGEQGGWNLYAFVGNRINVEIDSLGKIAIVLVIPLTITTTEAITYAVIAAAGICLSNNYCSKLATSAFVAPILAAVLAAKAISCTICSNKMSVWKSWGSPQFLGHQNWHTFIDKMLETPFTIKLLDFRCT